MFETQGSAMSHETSLQNMTVTDLALKCGQETESYFQHRSHDTRYCFELFRRAIRDRDRFAWDTICLQYQPLVTGWVRQHPRFEGSGEEVQYFVNGAFGKIAGVLTPDKFGGFSDLGSLLRYLKMCVHSVIVDYIRSGEQTRQSSLEEAPEVAVADAAPEDEVLDRASSQSLWEWLNSRLLDEKERKVIHGLFVLDLKPQELYQHYQSVFKSVDEVYRIRQNVIARLRRDEEFRKLLGDDD